MIIDGGVWREGGDVACLKICFTVWEVLCWVG